MSWKDYFKSEEEKQKEAREREKEEAERQRQEYEEKLREAQDKELDKELDKVVITPETKDEYEKRVGHKVKVIEIRGRQDVGVHFYKKYKEGSLTCLEPFDLRKGLVEKNIEAIVNCNYSMSRGPNDFYDEYWGIPVARVNGEEEKSE